MPSSSHLQAVSIQVQNRVSQLIKVWKKFMGSPFHNDGADGEKTEDDIHEALEGKQALAHGFVQVHGVPAEGIAAVDLEDRGAA